MRKQLLMTLGIVIALPIFADSFRFTYEGQTLDYAVMDEEVKTVQVIRGNDSISGDLVIPPALDYEGTTYVVTSIGEDAFRGFKEMTSVEIPATVNTIEKMAFYGCDGLKKAGFASIAQVCGLGFGNEFANPLQYAYNLYIEGEEIKDLVIPDSVCSIGENAFNSCRGLTSVKIPDSVTEIGNYAFKCCNGLISAEIPASAVSLGRGIFYGCLGLTSVQLPATISSIEREMFYGCGKLEEIDIPNSVTSIGNLAFYYCKGLREINIPESVSLIEGSAFEGCKGLETVELPMTLTSIRTEVFRACGGLKSIVIPDSVVSIGNGAFYGCSSLVSVNIPEKVIYLGERSFMNCTQLEEITFPPSLEIIKEEAFRGSDALKTVIYRGETPLEGNENIFDSYVYENGNLCVGDGLKDKFAEVTPWKFFSLISEIPSESDKTGIGIMSEETSDFDFSQPIGIYNLQGVRSGHSINSLPAGIYIIRQGNKVRKIKGDGFIIP
ncbi:MAG: leucine-rich repeat domain-containing protein [Muribaculaceae bacterium]|nr:leucine-rich repeat domain-containing protein [Muribaculaceae bacterium]